MTDKELIKHLKYIIDAQQKMIDNLTTQSEIISIPSVWEPECDHDWALKYNDIAGIGDCIGCKKCPEIRAINV